MAVVVAVAVAVAAVAVAAAAAVADVAALEVVGSFLGRAAVES